MANKVQILDKVARNLAMLGIAYARDVEKLTVSNGSNNLVISYVDADIAAPLGGINGQVSPFLGMGIASPGSIKIEGAGVNTAVQATVGELINSATAAKVLHLVSGFANSIMLVNVNAGAGADLSVEIEGNVDLKMMGQ